MAPATADVTRRPIGNSVMVCRADENDVRRADKATVRREDEDDGARGPHSFAKQCSSAHRGSTGPLSLKIFTAHLTYIIRNLLSRKDPWQSAPPFSYRPIVSPGAKSCKSGKNSLVEPILRLLHAEVVCLTDDLYERRLDALRNLA
jgi:hypothetical protein